MRIPFPERIPIDRVAVFAVLLAVIQGLEGTPFYFSAGCIAFLILAALAFNLGGGLARAAGAYVFFYSTLVVIIGLCYKAFLGERADSNLSDPYTTIEVYVGGMISMLVAVLISRRFTPKRSLVQRLLKDADLKRSAVGCLVFGIGGPFFIGLLGESGAKLNSAFAQLNQLVPLAIIIATMYELRRSGGTRSLNPTVLFGGIYFFFFYGMLGFSKAGLLTPLFCWLLPVAGLRFRITALQAANLLFGLFLIFYYLVPYSQYGRTFANNDQSFSKKVEIAVRLMSHPADTRAKYQELQETADLGRHYYNGPQGFFDRLQFISVDDSLINITDQGQVFGYLPVFAQFVNAVPHFIYPDKPSYNFGNIYAHEVGGISEDDDSTGISFSPTAEIFHIQRWEGLFVAAPLIWFLLFFVLDSLFGDLRASPWGLLVLSFIAHAAPETGITGAIYLATTGTLIFLFCAFFGAWIAPSFSSFILGRDRSHIKPVATLQNTLSPRLPNET